MANCSMCGMSVPDGQGVCSMCYGDPFFGSDGFYMSELERELRFAEDLKETERMMENDIPLEDWDDEAYEDALPF